MVGWFVDCKTHAALKAKAWINISRANGAWWTAWRARCWMSCCWPKQQSAEYCSLHLVWVQAKIHCISLSINTICNVCTKCMQSFLSHRLWAATWQRPISTSKGIDYQILKCRRSRVRVLLITSFLRRGIIYIRVRFSERTTLFQVILMIKCISNDKGHEFESY